MLYKDVLSHLKLHNLSTTNIKEVVWLKKIQVEFSLEIQSVFAFSFHPFWQKVLFKQYFYMEQAFVTILLLLFFSSNENEELLFQSNVGFEIFRGIVAIFLYVEKSIVSKIIICSLNSLLRVLRLNQGEIVMKYQ